MYWLTCFNKNLFLPPPFTSCKVSFKVLQSILVIFFFYSDAKVIQVWPRAVPSKCSLVILVHSDEPACLHFRVKSHLVGFMTKSVFQGLGCAPAAAISSVLPALANSNHVFVSKSYYNHLAALALCQKIVVTTFCYDYFVTTTLAVFVSEGHSD